MADFLPIQKTPKIEHLQKPRKIIKILPLGAQSSDFIDFDAILASIFGASSRNTETAYFETSIERNARSCLSRPPILISKINPKLTFFREAFLDQSLLNFMALFHEYVSFLPSPRDLLGPKLPPKFTQVAQFWRFGPPFWAPADPEGSPKIALFQQRST